MKIKAIHLDKLKSAIDSTLTTHNSNGELVNCYETGNFNGSDKVKSLQQRFCFDLLYGTGLTSWVCSDLYPYLDDSHLYSALKSICPKVTKRY